VDKAPDAFRTISEVADELDVPQHVLRFWESRFREIKPLKRGGGRRYYRPEDVGLLRGIRHLLYGEGYTIRGVQRILREQGARFVQDVWQPGAPRPVHGPSEDVFDDAAERPTQAEHAPRLFGRSSSQFDEGDPPKHDAPALAGYAIAPAVAQGGLRSQDMQKLQTALHELGECRKLLDAAIADWR
jgi:DNA-binding transcriptional MerR regulator